MKTFFFLTRGQREKILRFARDKLGLNKKVILLVAAVFTGIAVAAAALLLKLVIEVLAHLTFQNPHAGFWIFLFPAAGGLAAGLIQYHVQGKQKGTGGVEATIRMLRVDKAYSRRRDVISRFLSSAITLGTGGSAGKEAPVVHLGGGLGGFFGKLFHFPETFRRTLIGAGSAAGIATAFHAPIAGSFFALEILLADFTLDTFAMIVVAAVAATAFAQSFGEFAHPLYSPEYSFGGPGELLYFGLLGVLGGLVNVLFVRSLEVSGNLFSKTGLPLYARPALGGLLLGLTALIFPFVLGEGYAIINALLKGQIPETVHSTYMAAPLVLLTVLLLKIIATSLSLGSGGSGGTLIPALFLGAGTGALFSSLLNLAAPSVSVSAGTWALAGMASVIAGLTQAPLFTITLFFELSRNYESLLPVLIVVATSMLTSRHFLRGSLYSRTLKKQGIQLHQGMELSVMENFTVSEVMHRRINLIKASASFGDVIEGFLHSPFSNGFVISPQGGFIGTISLEKIREFIHSTELYHFVIAEEIAQDHEYYLFPEQSLAAALEIMDQVDSVFLPVLENAETMKPIAYVTRKEIVSVYNREVVKKGTQNVLIEQAGTERSNYLHLGNEFHIETITAPREWVGKTLREIDMRATYNLTVIGLRQQDQVSNIIPGPNYALQANDQLTIVGKPEDIENLSKKISEANNMFRRFFGTPWMDDEE